MVLVWADSSWRRSSTQRVCSPFFSTLAKASTSHARHTLFTHAPSSIRQMSLKPKRLSKIPKSLPCFATTSQVSRQRRRQAKITSRGSYQHTQITVVLTLPFRPLQSTLDCRVFVTRTYSWSHCPANDPPYARGSFADARRWQPARHGYVNSLHRPCPRFQTFADESPTVYNGVAIGAILLFLPIA